jgi:hypothetical protein
MALVWLWYGFGMALVWLSVGYQLALGGFGTALGWLCVALIWLWCGFVWLCVALIGPHKIVVHPSRLRRIIQRLFVMGGTIAQSPAGRQASPPGRRGHPRARAPSHSNPVSISAF